MERVVFFYFRVRVLAGRVFSASQLQFIFTKVSGPSVLGDWIGALKPRFEPSPEVAA